MDKKEVKKIFREESKNYKWKFKSFFAYKAIGDFFYVVYIWFGRKSPNGNFYLQLCLEFKPLIIDELFWDITNLKDNFKMPLSFRGSGAFTFSPKEIDKSEFEFTTQNELVEFSKKHLNKIEKIITETNKNVTNLDDYLNYIENNRDNESEWNDIDLLVGTNIALKKYDKALSLCKYAKNNRKMGGWGFSNGDFYDLAIDYMGKNGV